MKKFFITLTSLILICIITIGCGQTDANLETSKALNKNLNLLTNTINRLDTIDNEYLVNNELYSIENINTLTQLPTPNKTGEAIKLASSFNVIINEDNISTQLKEALSNEIINRLFCDQNGNCKLCNEKYICDTNGNCSSCNQTVICDNNGNCTQCGNTLTIENNNCSNCGSNCVKSSNSKTCGDAILNNLRTISNHNKDLKIEFLNMKNNNIDDNSMVFIDNMSNDDDILSQSIQYNTDENIIQNNNTILSNNDIIDNEFDLTNQIETANSNASDDEKNTSDDNTSEDNNTTIDEDDSISVGEDNELDNSEDNELQENIEEKPIIKYYYYSEETFDPTVLRYKPRFVNRVNYSSANSNIERYIEKLQKLYTMTADVVEANNTLANYKVLILNDIDEARKLNNCILTGECVPNSNQRQALDNYIIDIRNTINHLRNCNGELTNEINKISSSNTGITHSIDVTNSNYLRILNHIDTRISYHENAIATLEQIKYILEDTQNNSDTNIDIEDLNSNIKEDIVEDYIENMENIDNPIKDGETIIIIETEDNNIADGDYIENNVDNDTIINNDDILQDDYIASNNNSSNNENIPNEDIIIDENLEDNEAESKTEENYYTNVDSNTAIDNNIDEEYLIDNEIDNTISNIDTYDEPTYNNLDLYDNEKTIENSNHDDNNLNDNLDNNLDNDNLNSNLENNELNNINNDDYTITNSSNDSQSLNGTYEGNDFNNLNSSTNGEFGYANGFNGNNLHENTIISQNNINGNDLENNAYHYDEDGHLYNNTNGYNSDNVTNINNNNNNVNTYKYNTLIDSINRGTVNNGINNLSIA